MGPNKTALIHFTNRRTPTNHTYTIPTTKSYKYLGKEIKLRSNHTAFLNAWKTGQVKARLKKFKSSMAVITKSAFLWPESFSQVRQAIISLSHGNLYGIADHTTPVYDIYARGALVQWEYTLRRTLRRILMLPKNFPNDILHMVTGILSIAVFLRQRIIQRLALLIKTYDNTNSVEEKKLIEYNVEEMTRN